MSSPSPAPESFLFISSVSPSLAPYTLAVPDFLASHPEFDGICTGALVFHPDPTLTTPKVLLVQRAPHDSKPLCWEIPGGTCDLTDPSILHGLAREIWEEAGLRISRVVVTRPVGDRATVFFSRRGTRYGKWTFEVEVLTEGEGGLEVRLNPNEHVSFVWAGEEECREGRVVVRRKGGQREIVEIEFTTSDQRRVLLDGFRERRERMEGWAGHVSKASFEAV